MKKNKTVAYALAATLLVGGTFLGTKALFTDKIDTVGELSISTGDVDIDAEVVKEWSIVRNGEEANVGTGNEKGQPKIFDNLKTGDVISKQIKITNKGTLSTIVSLNQNTKVTESLPDGINLKAEFKDSKGNIIDSEKTFASEEFAIVDLTIDVTGGGLHNQENSLNTDDQEKTFIDLEDAYIVNAVQQNPKGIR